MVVYIGSPWRHFEINPLKFNFKTSYLQYLKIKIQIKINTNESQKLKVKDEYEYKTLNTC